MGSTNHLLDASNSDLLQHAFLALEQLIERSRISEADSRCASPADGALRTCLGSAAALVDVAQTLLRSGNGASTDGGSLEWQALIAHTKMASRRAHQAAVQLSAHRSRESAKLGFLSSGEALCSGTPSQ